MLKIATEPSASEPREGLIKDRQDLNDNLVHFHCCKILLLTTEVGTYL